MKKNYATFQVKSNVIMCNSHPTKIYRFIFQKEGLHTHSYYFGFFSQWKTVDQGVLQYRLSYLVMLKAC